MCGTATSQTPALFLYKPIAYRQRGDDRGTISFMNCYSKYGCYVLPARPDKDYQSLKEMVNWYSKKRKGKVYTNMHSFKTLLDCITGAPGANKEELPDSLDKDVPRYKKGSHQRRLTNAVINNALAKFKALNLDPCKFADFDCFVDHITAHTVHRFGSTCIYDFCLNYDYKFGLKPENKVYIHAGPAESVKALRKHNLIKVKVVDNRIDLKALPTEIQRLNACEAEDFLCVFHNAITKLFK